MNANYRAVDHLHIGFMGLNNRVHETILDPCCSPSVAAIVNRGRRAIALGEIRPGSSRAQHPEAPVDHPPIIEARLAARLVGKKRQDQAPLEITQFITSHVKTLFGALKHDQPIWSPLDAFNSLRPKTAKLHRKQPDYLYLARSASTISQIISSSVMLGVQHNCSRALDASPSSISTSAGLYSDGSMTT